jgi:hypothetical protein
MNLDVKCPSLCLQFVVADGGCHRDFITDRIRCLLFLLSVFVKDCLFGYRIPDWQNPLIGLFGDMSTRLRGFLLPSVMQYITIFSTICGS